MMHNMHDLQCLNACITPGCCTSRAAGGRRQARVMRGLVEFPPEDDLDARFTLPGLFEMSATDVPSFLLPSNSCNSIGRLAS